MLNASGQFQPCRDLHVNMQGNMTCLYNFCKLYAVLFNVPYGTAAGSRIAQSASVPMEEGGMKISQINMEMSVLN